MADGSVHVEVERGVATVTVDRPPLNALSVPFCDVIAEAIRACGTDPAVRAIVLTGAGSAFGVGADLSGGPATVRDQITADGGDDPDYREPASRVTLDMDVVPVPIVAAVNGDAAGGGATIALGADVRFCATTTRFTFPFTRLGVCPEGGSTYRLARLVGEGPATDWLLSGRLIESDEALATGLVTRVLPVKEVLPAAQAWAKTVATRCDPLAVVSTRALLRAPAPATAAEAAYRESRAIVALSRRPQHLEGISAFLERRLPRFTSRPCEPPAGPATSQESP